MHLNSGDDITRSYSAQYYNLSALQSYQGKLVEMGDFALIPRAMILMCCALRGGYDAICG